ncbi:MAG TPA: phosphoglycerate kinase [Dehalococcoidia bacterium]|nr:phosphoglycerate kinase [Dehalococcoidia bacterium]
MKQSVRDVDVAGKRVLMRVDFNVPFGRDGKIADDSRISAALPTVNYLLEHGASVILCSHLGRPDGKVVESLRLTPVADRLAKLLGKDVQTAPDCVGPQAQAAASALSPGEVLLLENLRFHPEEEENDSAFARSLASLADVYVNDAFGTAHRAHASTAGVAAYLPAVAGFLMLREVEELGSVLSNPERPMAAIIGGAKISSKLGVVTNLLQRVDCLMLGGGMASTFIKARGMEVGDSLIEEDMLSTARDLMYQAERRGVPLLLPTDAVIADAFDADAAYQTVPVSSIPIGWRVMDVGPDSVATFRDALEDCRTVFWNGPLGVAEFPTFAKGSEAMAQALADLDARVVIGGGETAALVEQMGLHDRYTHVSTGGGASLEFIEGKALPGVEALLDK